MKIKTAAVLTLIVLTFVLCAGENGKIEETSFREEKPSFFPYWHQRASLFRALPNKEQEIIFLGDSLIDGCNWSELLDDSRIINRGISGDTTQGVLARLDEVTESGPLKIFLMIGVNDLGRGNPPEQILNNLKLIIKRIKEDSPDTEIYCQSILPVNPDFKIFPEHTSKTEEIVYINKALSKSAGKMGFIFIDLFPFFSEKDSKLSSQYTNDGVHLNGQGYLVWKKTIEKHLR